MTQKESVILDKDTLKILKSFTAINKSLLVRAGNVVSTTNDSKSIYAEVKLKDVTFPVDFALMDLYKFIRTITTLDKPSIKFHDGYCIITGGESKVKYCYSDEEMFTHPQKATLDIPFKTLPVVCELTKEMFDEIRGVSSSMGFDRMAFVTKKGALKLVIDFAQDASNCMVIDLPFETVEPINVSLSLEGLAFLPGDYQVRLYSIEEGQIHSVHFDDVSSGLSYLISAAVSDE